MMPMLYESPVHPTEYILRPERLLPGRRDDEEAEMAARDDQAYVFPGSRPLQRTSSLAGRLSLVRGQRLFLPRRYAGDPARG